MAADLTDLQALDMWRRAIVSSVRIEAPDLSARQMALLLTVYLTPSPHTVRGLAGALKVSKPAITRAVTRLSEMGMVRRKTDEADRRSVLIQRTVKGSVFLREFGELIVAAAGATYELGGPTQYSFKEIMELLLAETGRRRFLVPVPFAVGALQAWFLEMWPKPILTRDQVKLLKRDNVVSGDAPGFKELGIEPVAAEAVLPTYLHRFRPSRG